MQQFLNNALSRTKLLLKMDSNTASEACSPGEKCPCEAALESDSSNSESPTSCKDKKRKMSLFNLRRTKRTKKIMGGQVSTSPSTSSLSSKKWSMPFGYTKKEPKVAFNHENQTGCKCTCYRRTEETFSGNNEDNEAVSRVASPADVTVDSSSDSSTTLESDQSGELGDPSRASPTLVEGDQGDGIRGTYGTATANSNVALNAPFVAMQWMRTIHEDSDEAARLARAREIEQGVEAPANFRLVRRVQLLCPEVDNDVDSKSVRTLQLVCPPDLSVEQLRALFQNTVTLRSCPVDSITGCHTQVDFIHCLVPDLLSITNCSFYWGKMDRYEAERLLDGKKEGTFLLRDSAQEEFLFSVSFRKYNRSLHARIEQWNHLFSFDSHDPCVFTSNTVCGLLENYKDPNSCMFFEPMLTWPLHRNFTFTLQHLARAAIVNRLTYDNINHLQLPKTLKAYLKEYHYRQKVRVERFDDDVQLIELRNMPP